MCLDLDLDGNVTSSGDILVTGNKGLRSFVSESLLLMV